MKPLAPRFIIPPQVRLLPLLLITVLPTGLGCTTTAQHDALPPQRHWDVEHLRMQIRHDPSNAEALHTLGVIYLHAGRYVEAGNLLQQALSIDETNPETWLYLGLSQELLGRTEAALETYRQARLLSRSSPFDPAIQGRYRVLRQQEDRQRLDETPAETLEGPAFPERIVVLPITCLGTQRAEADLGRGLGALVSQDLSQIPDAEVIVSFRVRRLLGEPGRNTEDLDSTRYLQAARLFGAGRVVEGRCALTANDQIRLDLTLHDLTLNQRLSASGTEQLQNVVLLEKEVVGQLIEQTGIWATRPRDLPPSLVRQAAASGLPALLALSEGLAYEEAGKYEQAAAAYRRAAALYPAFTLAAERAEAVADAGAVQGTDAQELLRLATRIGTNISTRDLVEARLLQLGWNVGTGFAPDPNSRRLPSQNLGELPEPPRPSQ